jgi:hypothetical protein
MGESRSSGSGSVSVDIERISFGGKVRTSNNQLPPALLHSCPLFWGFFSLPDRFVASWILCWGVSLLQTKAFLCWIVFPFLRFSWSPSDLHHGLWRHLFIHVFCLVLAGQALVVPLLFFLCCCLAMLLTSKSRLHFWGFCVQFCLTVVHRSARQVKHQWILQANSVYLCISSGSPWFSLLWLTIIAQTWKVSLQVTLFLVLTGHTHTAFMNSPGPSSENEVWICICGRVWRPRKARAHHIPWCSSEL